jgi:pyruvate dehydrogenase complex dehydrogenase (E1) component
LNAAGAVAGNTVVRLGVERFGQSDDTPDLYGARGTDTEAILDTAARACLAALRQTK